jgi:hypothetical protein
MNYGEQEKRDSTILLLMRLGAVMSLAGALWVPVAAGEELKGHQVFFRGGGAFMNSDRAGEPFTDTAAPAVGTRRNDGGQGWFLGAGLDQMMHKDFLG